VQALLAAADETMKQRNVESVLFEGRRVGEQTNAEKLDWFAAQLVAELSTAAGAPGSRPRSPLSSRRWADTVEEGFFDM
jgi:hypothetical protein